MIAVEKLSSQRSIWGSPFFEIINPEHNSLKASLIDHCGDLQRRDGGGVASGVAVHAKAGLYESRFDLFSAQNSAIQALRAFCEQSLRVSLKSLAERQGRRRELDKAVIELHESWVHVTKDGGYHDVHIHANCSWCGVYYVDSGDTTSVPDNGATLFYAPFRSTYDDFGARLCSSGDVLRIAPREAKLILFPSYVPHAAQVYRGQRDRIVIAFNARVFHRRP